MMQTKPLVLIILDGWGEAPAQESHSANAIAKAHKPTWDLLIQQFPHTTLEASGAAVGLPEGQMGNSEVGHLTMGAGRVVLQDLVGINQAIETGEFNHNPVLRTALEQVALEKKALHVLGLLSDGGVHSHENHLYALLTLAAHLKVQTIWIHVFLDGRDTPPQSASTFIKRLEDHVQSLRPGTNARIASISGRYYAMDRDKRWDRTQLVYELLTTHKAALHCGSALEGLALAQASGETDEFVRPRRIQNSPPIARDDTVIFMNFRADRARQLSHALTHADFCEFKRPVLLNPNRFISLTIYDSNLNTKVAFEKTRPPQILAECLASQGLKQLRIAETEKYAHVTFFFNAGHEIPFAQEDRILIPSKKIATYDQYPAMCALEITEALIKAIESRDYPVIICNYANADMLGHTGNLQATIQAIECIDHCLGAILKAIQYTGTELLITADHGNADCLVDPVNQQPHTAHTTARVPFVYVGQLAHITRTNGTLADIAPTMLKLLGLSPPPEMTGTSLLSRLCSRV